MTEKNYMKTDLDVKLLYLALDEMEKKGYKLVNHYRFGNRISITIAINSQVSGKVNI